MFLCVIFVYMMSAYVISLWSALAQRVIKLEWTRASERERERGAYSGLNTNMFLYLGLLAVSVFVKGLISGSPWTGTDHVNKSALLT